jgi:hypothetical protein
MMNESPESDEFFGLLSELADGDLPPPRADRLRDLLRDDPEAQDLYLEFMKLHAHLHLAYDSGSGPADMPGGSSMPLKTLWVSPFEPAAGDVNGGELGGAVGATSSGRSWPSSPAVGLVLVGLFAIVIPLVSRPSEPRKIPIAARPLEKVDVSKGLAVVVRAAGVRWESSDGRIPKEGDVLPQCRLNILEGRATLSMLSGVTVVVEGPADIELLSMDRITCYRGKLRTKVPEGAEGFVVSGPSSAVVDLGTEFGVNIHPDGKSRGKVFKGEVEAAVFGASGAMRRSQIVKEEGEAFEIDPATGLIGPLTGPEDFVATSNPDPAPLILAPGYRDSVLEARPRCYWRFEASAGGEIPNEVPGRPPLLVTGPIRLAGTSTGNRCAVFGPGQTNQYLRMDEPWKPESSTGFAIELWFLSETIGHAALAGLLAPKDTTNHLSLVELTSSTRRTLFRPASARFLYRWPASRDGGENLFSSDIYVPYRWHHLVSQVAGDRMELYLDGVLQASQPIEPRGSEACQFLVGRLSTLTESDTIHHTGYRRPFVGLMDEVALYDRPLSAREVRAHLRLATRAVRPD